MNLNRYYKNLYTTPVDNLFKIFIEKFESVLNKHAPLKELSRTEMKFRSKPWLTTRISNSIKTKNTLYKESKKRNSPESFQRYKNVQKQFNSCEANAKKVWQGINDLLRRKKNRTFSLTKIIATDGRIITDANEICNYVNDYFFTIGSRMASSISVPTDADIHYKSLIRFNSKNLFLMPITHNETLTIINCLDSSKSSGAHNIPVKFIKLSL